MSSETRRPLVVSVDDEPETLRALARLLRRQPYDLMVTEDPQDVLEVVRERPIDVLIADQRMPSMSGVELIEEIRRRSPSTRVVMLTAFADSAAAAQRRRVAFDAFFLKPWNDDVLKGTILRLVGVEARVSPSSSGGSRFLRVDCKGRSSDDLLERIRPIVASGGIRTLVVLEDLGYLEGSVSRFLLDLVDLVLRHEGRILLAEGSGFARTFLQALGGAEPAIRLAAEDLGPGSDG